jgi:hypothetical protein
MLLGRRRGIMIESAAYDIMKEEGIQRGMLGQSRQDLIDVLGARFQLVHRSITATIHEIDDPAVLKILLKKAVAIDSLET